MEDFVYIILVIAWLAFSFMKRKPKGQSPSQPRPASRPQPASPPRGFDLEEALRDMLGGKPSPVPEPASTPVPEKESDEVVFEKSEPEYKSMSEELSSYQEPEYQSFGPSSAVSEEYRFSTEVRNQTLDDLIRASNAEDARLQAAEEMRAGLAEGSVAAEFNIRQAVVFSEILNRKYS